MTDATIAGGAFSIGRVFRLALSSIRANAGTFSVLSLAFVFLPAVLFGVIRLNMGFDGSDPLAEMKGVPGENIATTLLNLILTIGVVRASVLYFKGRRSTLGQALGASSKFLGLLGLTIVTNIAIAVGLILLIVPGLILYAMWAVALPAKIEEDLTVGGAMSRSMDLTKGHRPALVGIVLIYLAGLIVPLMLFSVLYGMFTGFGPTANLVYEVAVIPLFLTAFSLLSATVSAATYYELKRIKEGDETLAAIFS